MTFSQEAIETVAKSVMDSEEGEMIVPAETFWAHFGMTDAMREAQERVAALLADLGVDVAFEVVLSLPPLELPLLGNFEVPLRPAPLDLSADTLRALSVQQPWVELILRGEKNLEYRSRRVRQTGPLLLHASGTVVPENFEDTLIDQRTLPFRALVGVVDIVGVEEVEGEDSLYAWQLAHPRRFQTPIPYSGAAGIFRVDTDLVREALRNAAGVPR